MKIWTSVVVMLFALSLSLCACSDSSSVAPVECTDIDSTDSTTTCGDFTFRYY